jgi:hypothetical protein
MTRSITQTMTGNSTQTTAIRLLLLLVVLTSLGTWVTLRSILKERHIVTPNVWESVTQMQSSPRAEKQQGEALEGSQITEGRSTPTVNHCP